MRFDIVFSPDAFDHLDSLNARQRRIVLDAVESQLAHEPTVITRQRKPLRPNPFASWELRVEQFRVYYQVAATAEAHVVYVVAVGEKARDRIIIGGKEVRL